MVTKRKQHSAKTPARQGLGATARQPNKIGASTPYNFRGKKLTPYGGLLPVATLLEKLGFPSRKRLLGRKRTDAKSLNPMLKARSELFRGSGLFGQRQSWNESWRFFVRYRFDLRRHTGPLLSSGLSRDAAESHPRPRPWDDQV